MNDKKLIELYTYILNNQSTIDVQRLINELQEFINGGTVRYSTEHGTPSILKMAIEYELLFYLDESKKFQDFINHTMYYDDFKETVKKTTENLMNNKKFWKKFYDMVDDEAISIMNTILENDNEEK